MRIFIAILLFVSGIFAYDIGDKIDEDVASKLGLKSDKIYVLDFFASWCGSCKKEMPLLSALNKNIDKNRVEIIGIDADENPKKGMAFQDEMKKKGSLNFRVYNDPKGEIVSKFNPVGFPAVYIVKDLKVVSAHMGAKDHIDRVISKEIEGLK